VVGKTESADFPTVNPIQPANGATSFYVEETNAFVSKINPSGSALVYSTYLGGSTEGGINAGLVSDTATSVAVDGTGAAYMTGYANSIDFPTVNAIQSTNHAPTGEPNAFVAKFNPSGSALVYSTYLGGSGDVGGDAGTGVAVDVAGNAYVVGRTSSMDFPTVNPLQATLNNLYGDAFVTKINADGSALVYSTFLGGSGSSDTGADVGSGIAVDGSGNAYVTGTTVSLDFPTINAVQPIDGSGLLMTLADQDAFVAKIDPTGTALLYSTYLGGSSGYGTARIAIDNCGSAYVTGFGPPNFPVVNLSGGTAPGSGVLVAKLVSPTWQTVDAAVGSDGSARVLWSRDDGSVTVWSVDNNGVYSAGPAYGRFPGFTPRRIACGADGTTWLLWTRLDGTTVLWRMDQNNNYLASYGYGPYPGWTAQDIDVGVDNKLRVLWTNSIAGNSVAVWSVDSTGAYTAGPAYSDYGYYYPWVATRIAAGADGLTRILWGFGSVGSIIGRQALWLMDANNVYQSSFAFAPAAAPYNGQSTLWWAADLTVGADNKTRMLWRFADGSSVVWTVDNAGNYTYGPIYGPFPGWQPTSITSGADGFTRILWQQFDGRQGLWLEGQAPGSDDVNVATFIFGPY
jgi:hypothetical protein